MWKTIIGAFVRLLGLLIHISTPTSYLLSWFIFCFIERIVALEVFWGHKVKCLGLRYLQNGVIFLDEIKVKYRYFKPLGMTLKWSNGL